MRSFLICLSLLFLPQNSVFCGCLIEVCGIDGCGKTTFIKNLQRSLSEQGQKVVVLSPLRGDPTVYQFLNKIDALKKTTLNAEIHQRIDKFKSGFFLLSFLNQKPLIENLLSENDFVICDRYLFSFRTYQECFEQYEDKDESLLSEMPRADITMLIIVPIDVAIKRLENRGNCSYYENPVFLEKAQMVFLRDTYNYPNLVQIDGEEELEFKVKKALTVISELR